MSIRVRIVRLLALLILPSVVLPAMATSPVHHVRETAPPQTMRLIVEFHGTPAILSHGTTAASDHDHLFARFRSDLVGAKSAKSSSATVKPSIRHEYRLAILGAAVEVHPAAVERIRRLPYVRSVSADVQVKALGAAGATVSASGVVDAREKVNALSLGTGGAGVIVAVIDTGIAYDHPALGGGFGPGFKVAGGYDFVNQDDDPMDDNGHGTHVAGTIAASAPDLIGVAPDATLLAYKVLAAGGSGSSSDIIAAVERSLDPNGDGDPSDRAHVLNLSLGGPGDADDPVSRAVDAAVAAGVVVVVAAGNDGATATIGSPGTAVGAITVAAVDDNHAVTSFSSRGPSPRLLGFKPDVSAPGAAVVSARLGGGTVALNGTSMAAPHVAGVAALLLALHPDWDPLMIKGAIIGGAVAVDDEPFARGAGRVDAGAAHRTTLFRDQSGVSFGIRASRTGTSEESSIVRLTNRTTSPNSLTITPGRLPQGATITVTPAAFELAPGETREVVVQLQTSNELLEYPANALLGGDLVVGGTASSAIPWGILRSARATVTYDGLASAIYAVDSQGGRGPSPPRGGPNEIFLPSGRQWDFIVIGYDVPTSEGAPVDTRRIVVREDVTITDDHVIDLRGAEASLEIVLDSRDQQNLPIANRTASENESFHIVGSRMFRQEADSTFAVTAVIDRLSARRLFFSPLSERYTLHHSEQYIDYRSHEGYAIEHEELVGLTESRTFTTGGTELLGATVRWQNPPMHQTSFGACIFDATVTKQFTSSWSVCFPTNPQGRSSFDFFANDQRSLLSRLGMSFVSGGVRSQALRGRETSILISSEINPSPVADQISSGGEYMLAAGPAHPFAFPGTHTGGWFRYPSAGFYGSSGEELGEQRGTRWVSFDAQGRQSDSGVWGTSLASQTPPAPVPGGGLLAIREGLETFGRFSDGALDVTFGSNTDDLVAPTLTSLRIKDGSGTTSGALNRNDQASLIFSIADLDYHRNGETRPSRPEATAAWFRLYGSATWQPLPVTVTGSESGTAAQLRHVPAGDIYHADLTSATQTDNRWIDIMIQFQDASGNKVKWTHEMAFAVGDPSQPRRRATRR